MSELAHSAVRLAKSDDIPELGAMRWTFALEDAQPATISRADFDASFETVVGEGIAEGRLCVWLAEAEAQIVANAYVWLVRKIPRPTREHGHVGYLTNVYTRPAFRGKGIGAELLSHVVTWAAANDVELLFVWPSEDSVQFYERAGFHSERDPLVWTRP